MFTTKHIHLAGDEDLRSVSSVRYDPGKASWTSEDGRSGQSGTPATLWITEQGSGTEIPLTGGTVFVMNDAGKTVARYDLGASPVPIIGDGLADTRPMGVVPRQYQRA